MDKIKKILLTLLYFFSFIIWILIFMFCIFTLSSIGFVIIIFSLIIILALLKNNLGKLLIIIPFILILVFIVDLIVVLIVGSLSSTKNTKLSNWNKVKNDYELINKYIIDYYNGNCEEECNIYFDEKYYWLNNSYYVDKLELSNDLKNAIDNISNYQKQLNYHHQGLSYIKINSNEVRYISYIDAHPPFFVVYSRDGRNLSEYHYDCYYNECNSHLTDKWYQNNYEYHR